MKETYSSIELVRPYENLQSYWTTDFLNRVSTRGEYKEYRSEVWRVVKTRHQYFHKRAWTITVHELTTIRHLRPLFSTRFECFLSSSPPVSSVVFTGSSFQVRSWFYPVLSISRPVVFGKACSPVFSSRVAVWSPRGPAHWTTLWSARARLSPCCGQSSQILRVLHLLHSFRV